MRGICLALSSERQSGTHALPLFLVVDPAEIRDWASLNLPQDGKVDLLTNVTMLHYCTLSSCDSKTVPLRKILLQQHLQPQKLKV